VHGQVDAAIQNGLLDLFDKQPLAAHFGQRDIQNLVPLGLDDVQRDGDPGSVLLDGGFHPAGLP
jgi:hypothetical protein